MNKDLSKLSKFLAVILRHNPEEFALTLDEEGFTPLDPVWKAIREKYGNRYDEHDLLQIVAGDERGKKRYEIYQGRIRAMYGHSTPEVSYPPATPPEFLYHGTNPQALVTIRKEGLTAQARQYVHMTTNLDNAQVVAKRRTHNPLILKIRALDAHQAGTVFHHAETELGHIYLKNGKESEHFASDRVREEEDLGWKAWGKRVNEVFQHIDFIFSPDLLIVGGGVSKKYEKFFEYIDIKAKLVPAELRNDAGIIGAALAAEELV